MTKILLAALIAAMLALTGVVAYNQYNAPRDAPAAVQVTEPETDSCPACCEKEAASEACHGCCGGDAGVKPHATAPKAEAKKE
jgi:hypothetical protein